MSCTDNTAVLTGGVGGVMGLIIVCQSVLIVILLLRKRIATQTRLLCICIMLTWLHTVSSLMHLFVYNLDL